MKTGFLPRMLALFAALALCKLAQASPTAFDSAGDSAYNSGWTAGSNGGYGWNGGWDFKYLVSTTPSLASDPADGGIMNSPASPLGRAWELTGSNASVEPFVMRHTVSALQVGQTFSVDVDYRSGTMIFGFGDDYSNYDLLANGDAPPNGPNDYDILQYYNAFTGPLPRFEDAFVPVFPGPIHITLTELSTSGPSAYYNLQITSLTTGETEAIPKLLYFSYPLQANDVDTFYFGAVGPSVVYYNNISITPEPAALATLGIFSLLLLRRRRNRSAPEII